MLGFDSRRPLSKPGEVKGFSFSMKHTGFFLVPIIVPILFLSCSYPQENNLLWVAFRQALTVKQWLLQSEFRRYHNSLTVKFLVTAFQWSCWDLKSQPHSTTAWLPASSTGSFKGNFLVKFMGTLTGSSLLAGHIPPTLDQLLSEQPKKLLHHPVATIIPSLMGTES